MNDILKIAIGAIFGSCASIITTYAILKAENQKQIILRKHELAIKELGEKVYSPLLVELANYENKKNLERSHSLDIGLINATIIRYQYLTLFMDGNLNKIINNILKLIVLSTGSDEMTIKTQDKLIVDELIKLRELLSDVYSVYRVRL